MRHPAPDRFHQERSNVHGAFARGHPVLVGFDNLLHGVHEDGFNGRHLESVSAPLHSSSVFLGPEEHDAALRGPVRLHAFEEALPVVEHARSGDIGTSP